MDFDADVEPARLQLQAVEGEKKSSILVSGRRKLNDVRFLQRFAAGLRTQVDIDVWSGDLLVQLEQVEWQRSRLLRAVWPEASEMLQQQLRACEPKQFYAMNHFTSKCFRF